MENVFISYSEYNDILNRMQKKYEHTEGFFVTMKQYFTNNTFYYFLCLIFRFVPLILLSGNYSNLFKENNNVSFQKYVKLLTCCNLLKYIQISYKIYISINILIYISFFTRLIIYFYFIKEFSNYRYTNKWPIPHSYRIISDHFIFLLFPYLIEYLSFSYYILLFPDKFFIKLNNIKKTLLYAIIAINTFLIIFYNMNDYRYMICINRIYTTTLFEPYIKIMNEKNKINNKPIKYRCFNLEFFIIILFQNFALFESIENYLNTYYKTIFKLVISIIILLMILILFFSNLYEYNYSNLINTSLNIIIIFCFYSIIFDFILYLFKYSTNKEIFEMSYVLLKIFISYITYLLFILKKQKFFESKILEILFQEKKKDKEIYFLNSFYYLNEIILKIHNNHDFCSIYLLVKFLLKHINKCNKIACNCNLLISVLKKEDFENKKDIKNFISDLVVILNYLFECAFIEYDYYNNYELAILLSEHFCHLKNNPTMAFSVINTLLIKNKNKFSMFEMIVFYELSQKYIYYIYANALKEREKNIKDNKGNELVLNKQREEDFKINFNNSKISIQVKRQIINYIDNQISILKYRNIFEESLKFNFDESKEIITSVYIKFFNMTSNIDDSYIPKVKKFSRNFKKNEKKTNLYKVIYLINKEQLFYNSLIFYLDKMKIIKNLPILILFKYCLFFDFFRDGEIPEELQNKLHNILEDKSSLYNNYISFNEYSLLKEIYNRQNNNINSNYCAMFEYKKDLKTKYFNESYALKLGYSQKDIINKKIDRLMPKKFYDTHQNLLKNLIIGKQLRYLNTNEGYVFDSSSTILYSIKFEASLIYNISKNLSIVTKSSFILENEYIFMINNNFELLANSKNFEKEYFFNQKIFETYDIKLMDILQIKPDKLFKIFKKTFSKIEELKMIRRIKTDEYFIPQFYVPPGEKDTGFINPSIFNNSKINFLTKISNSKIKKEENPENNDDEKKLFINKEKNKKMLNELFNDSGQIIFHDNYNMSIEKSKFIENFSKELAKIPDNDLRFENDKFNYNLIISGKKFIKKLKKKNLLNNYLKINLKLSFYYDKPFYFIKINDEKKSYLTVFEIPNLNNNALITKTDKNNNNENILMDKTNQTLNKISKEDDKNKLSFDGNNFKINTSQKSEINKIDKNEKEKDEILNKIEKYKFQINKDKFILIIKIILFIIIICIFLLYIIIIIFQKLLIKRSQNILMAYYYNSQTRESVLNIYSFMLELYYHRSVLTYSTFYNETLEQDVIINYYTLFKENYYNFSNYYNDYNIEIGHNLNLIYNNKLFYKIEGFWEEVKYYSIFGPELEFIIFLLHDINTSSLYDFMEDINNFCFFENKTETHIKIESSFIKLLYHLCINYEFSYKNIFNEIEESIYNSFKEYIYSKMNYYLLLEILGLIFYIILFFSVLVYLYYSNQIIIKNIIFLFLDFSEEHFNKNGINTNNKNILKLFELKNLMEDFDLQRLEKYSHNLDKLNKNKSINISANHLNNMINSSFENNILYSDNKKNDNKINNDVLDVNRISINKLNSKKVILINKGEKENKKLNSKKNFYKLKSITNLDSKFNKLNDNKLKGLNDSSQNYLFDANSQIIKDKINNDNSLELNKMLKQNNKDIINNLNNSNNLSNNNNSNNVNSNQLSNKTSNNSNNYNNYKNNMDSKDEEIEQNESFQDILLNKSNQVPISFIRIYQFIIFIFIIGIIVFSIYKIEFTLNYKSLLNDYFIDFNYITKRYSLLTYYFNIIRTLLIFPNDERKKKFENIFENFNIIFNEQDKKYSDIISFKLNSYKQTKKLVEELQIKSNSTEFYINTVCSDIFLCKAYLSSSMNIFDNGADSAYKQCINQINNIFMDYSKLINKIDIHEIRSRITLHRFSIFSYISPCITYLFNYVQKKLFDAFIIDQSNFKNKYGSLMTTLNLITVSYSILTFLFVNIIIFFSILNYSEPIKNSTYRINCSFYFIKKYSFNK